MERISTKDLLQGYKAEEGPHKLESKMLVETIEEQDEKHVVTRIATSNPARI